MAIKKFAGPSEIDAAIFGRTNDATPANARTTAFVATSFFRASLFFGAPFEYFRFVDLLRDSNRLVL